MAELVCDVSFATCSMLFKVGADEVAVKKQHKVLLNQKRSLMKRKGGLRRKKGDEAYVALTRIDACLDRIELLDALLSAHFAPKGKQDAAALAKAR